jgi:hypothetical protein
VVPSRNSPFTPHPSMITAGPDGTLWFSESDVEQPAANTNEIGRFATTGRLATNRKGSR